MPEESTASRAIRTSIRELILKRCQISEYENHIVMLQGELETYAERVAELVVDEIEKKGYDLASNWTPCKAGSIDYFGLCIPLKATDRGFFACPNSEFVPLIEAAIIAEMVKRGMLEPDMEGQDNEV